MKVGLFLTNQQHLDTDMVSALGDQITMVHHARDRGWDSLFSGQHYLNEGNNKQLQIVPFIARLIPEAGEMTTGLGVLLLNLPQPGIRRRNRGDPGHHRQGQLRVRHRSRLPRRRVRRIRRAEGQARRAHGGVPGTRAPPVDRGLGDAPRRDLPARSSPDEHSPRAAAIAAGVGRRQQRPGNSAGRAYRRHVDGQSAFDDRDHSAPARPLPGSAGCGRQAVPRRASVHQGNLLCQGPQDRDRDGGAVSLREVPRLRVMGPGTLRCPTTRRSTRSSTTCCATDSFSARPEECYEQLRPYFDELGVNHLIFRTHWAGMPLPTALASMRLISDELLPALRKL